MDQYFVLRDLPQGSSSGGCVLVIIHCAQKGQLSLNAVEVMSLQLGCGLCCIAGASRVVGQKVLLCHICCTGGCEFF